MKRVTVAAGVRVLVLGLQLARSVLAQPALADAPPAPTAAAPGPSGTDEARAAFERGLALARAERYREARDEFLRAYQAHPHVLVLYNIAQCELLLGNLEPAAESLERLLKEGGESLAADTRQSAEQQLSTIREQLARQRSSELAPQPGPRSDDSGETAAHPAPAVGADVAQSPEPQRATLAWVLGGSGLVLLGGALGLYLWNDGRYDDWRRRQGALQQLPDLEQRLAQDPELWAHAQHNNELLHSIRHVDTVTGITAGLGVLALGAGVWQLLWHSDSEPSLTAGPGPELSWRMRW